MKFTSRNQGHYKGKRFPILLTSRLSLDQFKQNFDRNCDQQQNNVILPWKCRPKKLLYLSYYKTDFYQTFMEMMAMWSTTEMSHQLTFKVYIKVTIYKNHITAIIRPILTYLSPKWCNWTRCISVTPAADFLMRQSQQTFAGLNSILHT